jgi:hypothetical protein
MAVLGMALPSVSPALVPDCDDAAITHGRHDAAATGVEDPTAGTKVRVFAVQYRQELGYVTGYAAFRRKMDCLIRQYVLPDYEPGIPNIVVFNEDVGLATLGIGTRGAAARTIAAGPVKDPANIPGAIAAFAAVGAAYAVPEAYYGARFPDTPPQRLILASATDTFVRAVMKTFSDLAREHDVYVVASNNQPAFSESTDPADIAALADPDLVAAGAVGSVYVAIGEGSQIPVWNSAWMWSPNDGVEPYAAERYDGLGLDRAAITAADPRSNVIAENHKTPVTSIERNLLALTDDGDLTPQNTGPFTIPELEANASTAGKVKIGFGISLPAFQWGTPFGSALSPGVDPCGDRERWMRCLDHRGITLFLQPEANPNCCWTDYIDGGWSPPAFQSLSWLDSAWRAVADPSVANIRYAVTPFMVGNLVDLAFDGQSSIFERCFDRPSGGNSCDGNTARTHVGATAFVGCPEPDATRCDDPALLPYAGPRPQTIVMADWVLPDAAGDPVANRQALADRAHGMLAGSGAPEENDYRETAVWADLNFD